MDGVFEKEAPPERGEFGYPPNGESLTLMRFLILLMTTAIAVGSAAAAPCCARVILPIRIYDARAALCSESLTVGSEDRQQAGKCKCHNTH
jgi:hypothetical protein